MDTPRKTKSAPVWQEPEVRTGVRVRPAETQVRIDPDTAYSIGLLCQTLSDAGPEGLTLFELGSRTQMHAVRLSHVLRLALERDYVRRLGTHHFVSREYRG